MVATKSRGATFNAVLIVMTSLATLRKRLPGWQSSQVEKVCRKVSWEPNDYVHLAFVHRSSGFAILSLKEAWHCNTLARVSYRTSGIAARPDQPLNSLFPLTGVT